MEQRRGIQRKSTVYDVSIGTDARGAFEKLAWNLAPRRAGLLGMKLGMMPFFDAYGVLYPVTVVQIQGCFVTEVKTVERNGYNAVQTGTWLSKQKHLSPAMLGICRAAGTPPLRRFKDWVVDESALLPRGLELSARHFVPGQYVDARARSIGKGFQGVMKRFGFKGQSKSHGTSLAHRSPGSIGITGHSKVHKGKKMPGQMGNKFRTTKNMVVMRVDVPRNILYLSGNIAGKKGEIVQIKDSQWKPYHLWTGEKFERPFPTFHIPDDADLEEYGVQDAPKMLYNPLEACQPPDRKYGLGS